MFNWFKKNEGGSTLKDSINSHNEEIKERQRKERLELLRLKSIFLDDNSIIAEDIYANAVGIGKYSGSSNPTHNFTITRSAIFEVICLIRLESGEIRRVLPKGLHMKDGNYVLHYQDVDSGSKAFGSVCVLPMSSIVEWIEETPTK